jgi:hypothetical protein
MTLMSDEKLTFDPVAIVEFNNAAHNTSSS